MGDVNNILPDKITVFLDKERELIFSLRSFSFLAKRHGSVQGALDKFYKEGEISKMSEEYLEVCLDLAEAGFLYDKDFPRAEIEKHVTSKNLFNLIIALRKAISLSVPEVKAQDEADPQ